MSKICMYYDNFFPMLGGVETHISSITQDISDHTFDVLTNALPGESFIDTYLKNARIVRIGPKDRTLKPFTNKVVSKTSFPYRMISDVIRQKRKKKWLMNSEYDILHVHFQILSPNLLRVDSWLGTQFFSKLVDFSYVKKPKMLTIHGLMSLHPANKGNNVLRDYEHSFIDMFDYIICVDEYIYKHTQKYSEKRKLKKNIHFIPNPVDTDKFSYVPLPNKKKITVGFAARYDKLNNIDLVAALTKKCPDFIDLHIALTGSQEAITTFKSMCDNSKMHLYLNHAYDEMPKFFQEMDVVLNLRLVEGIGRTTLEAMSCGRPVVMIEGGNRAPVIHEKTGYIIQNNVDSLLSILNWIHENRTALENIGAAARRIIKDEFSTPILTRKIKDIYEQLMNEVK